MGFEFVTSLTKKRMKRARRACAVALAGLVLAGCAATSDAVQKEDEPVAEELSAETFTTVGKPTKTIETPWGPRENYDPVQDPEVISIFEEWFADSSFEFEDYEFKDPFKYSVIQIARVTHKLDFMRIGCEFPEHQYWKTNDSYYNYKLNYPNKCERDTLGSSVLTTCEQNQLSDRQFIPNLPDNEHLDGRYFFHPNLGISTDVLKKIGALENHYVVGSKIYGSWTDQLSIIFGINCRKWIGIKDGFDGFEFYLPYETYPAFKEKAWKVVNGTYEFEVEPRMIEFCEMQEKTSELCKVK